MISLDLSSTAIRALSSSMLSCPKLENFDLSDGKFIETFNLHSRSLRTLNLDGCSSLKEILVASEKMTSLDLSRTAIHALSSSMLSCSKLENFDLSDCKFIETFNLHSGSLRTLNLNGCSSLKEISVASEKMISLDLSGTAIHALSSSMLSCPKLEIFDLSDCKFIERFNLHSRSLRTLNLNGCSSLKEITVASEKMTSLNLSGTAICALSSSMLSCPKLEIFDVSDCKFIESFNLPLRSLRILYLDGCSSLKEISVTAGEMMGIFLSGCKLIESLNLHSKSLKELHLGGFSFVEEISVASEKITKLKFSSATIPSLSLSIGHPLSLEVLDLSGSNIESFPANIKNLSMLKELSLRGCRELVSLPELPPSLRKLCLRDCRKLMSLPEELPPSLIVLELDYCKLMSLPEELPPNLDIYTLEFGGVFKTAGKIPMLRGFTLNKRRTSS
ncbi:disease resistance-like protein DSC1 [Cajanus cajan]|uniref:disease resistance-like protein DSC1 n=1 Tax=Cajanus cajan TaxID=3821 RepID=UPI00098D859D|nr:disease resistance-like protein DSC1 [Cajanus cajan]